MQSRASAELGVVVVTYRSGARLPALLRTLGDWEPQLPVVVVDNATPGGPPDAPGATVISLDANRGYGTACNVGARFLIGRSTNYVAFLNPDVGLSGPSLSELAREMERRPHTGIATGPVVDPSGRRVASASATA